MGQSLTRLMQEAGGIFGRVHHLKFTNIERIHLGQVGTATLGDAGEHGFAFVSPMPLRDSSRRSMASDDPPYTSGSMSTRNFGCVPLCGE